MSSYIFELILVDIWGPYRQPSLTGASYFLTIVDDFSRSTWTFLMKLKSQAVSFLRKFFIMVKKQFQTNIKILRSDNGSEFLSGECQNILRKFGIIHKKNLCLYSPIEWKSRKKT